MNPFVLAVILVRFMGVWTVASFVPMLSSTVVRIFADGNRPSYANFLDLVASYSDSLVYPFVGMAVGVLCTLKSTWFARLLTRGLYPAGHCQRCGYNMASAGATTCPECGHEEPKPA